MDSKVAWEGFSRDMWVNLVRRHAGDVRLGPDRLPFDLTFQACQNPTCTCEAVTLCFRERDAEFGQAALAFDVQVDLAGSKPAKPSGLGAEALAMARGFAGSLKGPARLLAREVLLDHRRRLQCIPQTVAGYANRGEMVPYAHVAAGGQGDDRTYADTMDGFDDGDAHWTLIDLVCGKPGCDCQNVRLSFVSVAPNQGRRQFAALVPLGGGPPTYSDLQGVSQGEAERIYALWEADAPFDRADLRARYDQVRRLAVQGGAVALQVAPLPERSAKVAGRPGVLVPPKGRREPCPCGSGKRYKNCCGQAQR